MCVVTNCIVAKVSGEIQIQTEESSSKGLSVDVSVDGVLSSTGRRSRNSNGKCHNRSLLRRSKLLNENISKLNQTFSC